MAGRARSTSRQFRKPPLTKWVGLKPRQRLTTTSRRRRIWLRATTQRPAAPRSATASRVVRLVSGIHQHLGVQRTPPHASNGKPNAFPRKTVGKRSHTKALDHSGCCWDSGASTTGAFGSTFGPNASFPCFYPGEGTPVKTVHLIQSSHLDIGYTNSLHGVVNKYFDDWFPTAMELAAGLRHAGGPERYIYTTHSWLISLVNTTACKRPFSLTAFLTPMAPCSSRHGVEHRAHRAGHRAWLA